MCVFSGKKYSKQIIEFYIEVSGLKAQVHAYQDGVFGGETLSYWFGKKMFTRAPFRWIELLEYFLGRPPWHQEILSYREGQIDAGEMI